MIFLEPIGAGSGGDICTACGDGATFRILFQIDNLIVPERLPLCDECVVKLGNLAERARQYLRPKPRLG